MKADSLVELMKFDNSGTAHVIKAYLESEGIPCLIAGDDSLGFQQILTSRTGGIRLLVRLADLELARELLRRSEDEDDDSFEGFN